MDKWRPGGILGSKTWVLCACSFRLCQLRTDRYSSFLSCWMHASHLASWISYFDCEASGTIQARIDSLDARIGSDGGMTGARRVSPRVGKAWFLAVERPLGMAVLVCPATLPRIVSLVTYSSLCEWVWFVWRINPQLVRNWFESPSLLDSEHLTWATTS
jgi:hypothetical protein